ncbi:site-specific integrase [Nonomuraea sp. NPDC049758]|uniref:tyrosine-type recombinase/integrase n=1 Tax=Nonomuraea sp. NPDC049758 TaxID=3154360 RepID=UPI003446F516
MASAEKRGKTWRVKWKNGDGEWIWEPGFATKQDALDWGRDREAEVRAGTWIDPRAGEMLLSTWCDDWYEAQDLDITTMVNYEYAIRLLIKPYLGDKALNELTPLLISKWQKQLRRKHEQSTCTTAHTRLHTVLEDAVLNKKIGSNPAKRSGRRRGKLQEAVEAAESLWTTPVVVLRIAERAAIWTGREDEFIAIVLKAFTGVRWGELLALDVEHCLFRKIQIFWQLKEVKGAFLRDLPKGRRRREATLPPFLGDLLARQIERAKKRTCLCQGEQPRWHKDLDNPLPVCEGGRHYLFLGPKLGHFRRSNFGRDIWRPVVDGEHPATGGKAARPARPVVHDGTRWHALFKDGTPHDLRHSQETWLGEEHVAQKAINRRMGHKTKRMESIETIYTHVSDEMERQICDALERRLWAAVGELAAERPTDRPASPVAVLDELITVWRARQSAAGTRDEDHVPAVSPNDERPLPKISGKSL